MKLISTAQVIAQAFKNVGRMREIATVLAQYGFNELVVRIKISRFLPTQFTVLSKVQSLPAEERIRLAFEKLGTTFIKLGQVLATRPDLIPESYVEEFLKLQDRVAPVDFNLAKEQIETELQCPLENIFLEFNETPIAAASIAQVYQATLHSGKGVAVKVQRPGIQKILENDISILRGLAVLLERYIPEIRIFNPTGIVDEFFKTISSELDFNIEANNMRRIRANLAQYKKLKIPEIYSDHCTGKVIVMERFEGLRFNERHRILESKDVDPHAIIELGCDVFFHMVMVDGVFHGDFHGGNLFILSDNRIGLIDFGIVGRLSKDVRESVSSMFVALMDEDYNTLASEYLALSHERGECDLSALQKDLMDLISPYIGMNLGQVDIGKVLLQSTAVAARHHLIVPRELMLLFKAMMAIESLGKSLDNQFNLLEIGNRLARKTLAVRYSREQVTKDLILVGRDLQYLLQYSPKVFKRFLRKWTGNGFVLESRNKDIEVLALSVRGLSVTLSHIAMSSMLLAVGLSFLFLEIEPQVSKLSIPGLSLILLAWTNLFLKNFKTRKRLFRK